MPNVLAPLKSVGSPANANGLHLHFIAEIVSGWLIIAMIVFCPWAFGCAQSSHLRQIELFGVTQAWTIWTLNLIEYCLGGLLLLKLCLRHLGRARFQTAGNRLFEKNLLNRRDNLTSMPIERLLVTISVLILVYSLISIVNARSSLVPADFSFEYHKFLNFLPHSYDRMASWSAFLNNLGLVFCFWSTWDWLQKRSIYKPLSNIGGNNLPKPSSPISSRIRRVVWALAINGTLLALVGILQRLSGTNKLLWLVKSNLNDSADFQFGPYAYYANAAQYFNLLWPLTLAFWWFLQNTARQSSARRRDRFSRHHFLLFGVIMMASCPILSGSRGGAIIALVCLALSSGILLLSINSTRGATKFGLFIILLTIVGLGLFFGGDQLAKRMQDFNSSLAARERIYATAKAMSQEHPIFGTGPGTFNLLFQFYRSSPDEYWPAQLHNDWLETLITFGWLGSAMIGLALITVLARWFFPGGTACPWPVVALIWISLASCLAHARFDFPFQVLSITVLFLTICAILFTLSREDAT